MTLLRIGAGLLLICIGLPLCWFSARQARVAVGSDRFGSMMGSVGGGLMMFGGFALLFDLPAAFFLPGECAYC